MSQTVSLQGVTRTLAQLEHAFSLGRSVERPGVVTATHTATWHMAGMIELLHKQRADLADRLRHGQAPALPVTPDEEPT